MRGDTTGQQNARGGELYESWTAQRASRDDRMRALWAMTREQRVAAMYRGLLAFDQLCAWAGARPDEVPRLNGEFWFIVIHDADVAEADECDRSTS